MKPAVLSCPCTAMPVSRPALQFRGRHRATSHRRRGQQTNSEWINRARARAIRVQQLIAFVRGRGGRGRQTTRRPKKGGGREGGGAHHGDNDVYDRLKNNLCESDFHDSRRNLTDLMCQCDMWPSLARSIVVYVFFLGGSSHSAYFQHLPRQQLVVASKQSRNSRWAGKISAKLRAEERTMRGRERERGRSLEEVTVMMVLVATGYY